MCVQSRDHRGALSHGGQCQPGERCKYAPSCNTRQIKLPSTANAHSFLAPCNNATGKLVAPQERYFHFSSLNVFLISAKTSRDCFYFNFAILTLTLTRDWASTSLGYNYLWSNSNKSFYSLYNFLRTSLPIKSFYLVIIFTFLSNLLEFGNYTQACKVHRGAAQSFLTCLKAHISGFMQCATSSWLEPS